MSRTRLAVYGAIALAFAVLAAFAFFQLAQAEGAKRRLDVVQTALNRAEEANQQQALAIKLLGDAREDNDEILIGINQELQRLQTRTVETRTIIEREAQRDPATSDWLNEPIPGGVSDALNRNAVAD